jgi:hypothetical protein
MTPARATPLTIVSRNSCRSSGMCGMYTLYCTNSQNKQSTVVTPGDLRAHGMYLPYSWEYLVQDPRHILWHWEVTPYSCQITCLPPVVRKIPNIWRYTWPVMVVSAKNNDIIIIMSVVPFRNIGCLTNLLQPSRLLAINLRSLQLCFPL